MSRATHSGVHSCSLAARSKRSRLIALKGYEWSWKIYVPARASERAQHRQLAHLEFFEGKVPPSPRRSPLSILVCLSTVSTRARAFSLVRPFLIARWIARGLRYIHYSATTAFVPLTSSPLFSRKEGKNRERRIDKNFTLVFRVRNYRYI